MLGYMVEMGIWKVGIEREPNFQVASFVEFLAVPGAYSFGVLFAPLVMRAFHCFRVLLGPSVYLARMFGAPSMIVLM
jgi:hypothetical protein